MWRVVVSGLEARRGMYERLVVWMWVVRRQDLGMICIRHPPESWVNIVKPRVTPRLCQITTTSADVKTIQLRSVCRSVCKQFFQHHIHIYVSTENDDNSLMYSRPCVSLSRLLRAMKAFMDLLVLDTGVREKERQIDRREVLR